MNISMMKAKDVKSAIRNGKTIAFLCEKYDCDEEGFKERLRQLYYPDRNPKRYNEVLAGLDANEKRIRKKTGVGAKNVARKGNAVGILTDAELKQVAIEALKNKAAESEHTIMELESQMRFWVEEHSSLKQSLHELTKKIDQVMADFRKSYKEFRDTSSELTQTEMLIASATARLDRERITYRDTIDRIVEMSMVTLGVYSSGDISPMDGELVPDDTGWEEVRDTLMTMPECQELRLKDIGTLARLLMIVEHADCKIEAMCDDAELEAVFRKLHAQEKVDNGATTTA